LVWAIEFLPEAAKELRKLDRQVAARIVRTLDGVLQAAIELSGRVKIVLTMAG
jgi:mRNA-degrading endonuclease RelE of RelBE toxin-antitoxin system